MTWLLLLACAGVGDGEAPADDSAAGPVGPDRDQDGWSDDEDCDPDDPQVHPGATEDCDGVDDDCDTIADDGFPAQIWHLDADGDGYGSPTSTQVSCTEVPGYVLDAGDCDDDDPTVHPGAEELCNDGKVQDCDGTAEAARAICGLAGDLGPAAARATWTGEAAEDLPGAALLPLDDLDGDGAADLAVSAPAHDATVRLSGAVYLLAGTSSGPLADARAKLSGQAASDAAGTSLASPGDLDGDGLPELLVGAPGESGAANNAGAVYLVSGSTIGSLDLDAGLATLRGLASNDRAGQAVVGGDGRYAVGAYAADANGNDAGAVYVFRRPVSGAVSLSSADATWTGATYMQAGYALARAGDVDGDGVEEWLVGVPNEGSEAGAVYVVDPSTAPSGPLSTVAQARIVGATAGDKLGRVMAAAGDVTGDGLPDLVLGSPDADPGGSASGAAWLLAGPFAGDVPVSGATWAAHGVAAGEHLGSAVGGAGDLDGDGRDELLVGVPEAAGGGLALYFRSALAGTVYATDADARFTTDLAGGRMGAALAGGVDLDGDGTGDVVVAAPAADGVDAVGAVYRFAGEGP